ncbi:PepSY domain-containing protein [Psychrobacter sp. DAB_AL62B]|uniref:PepSY domain-containing protein n=1 Tax=Psychrobacter sp. DAB_AL62B TaxID=1028420 RepID=UPI002380FF12|nr:PepSY domain-containing protein [Psychrobacter sp. DAB_AL62B]MDE4455031.1 peptidase [Psychrobacter sp. DAB_AL62B]
MKNLSTLSKSIIMVLSIAGVSTAAIAVGQTTTTNSQVSEAVAAAQSKISLEQAIVIAKKTIKGDVVSADFDQHDHSAGGNYEVKIVANNTEYEVKIDANSGKVLSNKQEKLDKEDIAEYNAMKKSKTSLNQAIKKANQSVKGKVIEAGFDMDFGKPAYKVEIVKGTQVHKVVIDSMTGKIIRSQVEAADSDD